MTCYICDHERVSPQAQAMSDDEWGEGCASCERDFWEWVDEHHGATDPKSEAAETPGRAATDGFAKACDHAWHWTGTEFACAHCSQPTAEPQALTDMGEPA